MKNKSKSGKGTSEKGQFWEVGIVTKCNSEQRNLKKDRYEKETSGKGYIWKGNIWKRAILERNNLEKDNSEKETYEKEQI